LIEQLTGLDAHGHACIVSKQALFEQFNKLLAVRQPRLLASSTKTYAECKLAARSFVDRRDLFIVSAHDALDGSGEVRGRRLRQVAEEANRVRQLWSPLDGLLNQRVHQACCRRCCKYALLCGFLDFSCCATNIYSFLPCCLRFPASSASPHRPNARHGEVVDVEQHSAGQRCVLRSLVVS